MHTVGVRETGIEQGHAINTAIADVQIARLRVHSAKGEGLKRRFHA
jgi:hypothetical protein